MQSAEQVLAVLRKRGELWEAAPGLVGMRGDLLALHRALERAIAELARGEAPDEWGVPAALAWDTLKTADYFASFPQWLSAASHLSSDAGVLERVARGDDPRRELALADAALPPAICYHTYAALAGRILESPRLMTAQGTCWRHEGERLAALERGWAFTMREVVCLGAGDECEVFRCGGIEQAIALAESLGLDEEVVPATDPFFAPTARGKELLQRIKGLKHELVLPLGPDRGIAAASFNHHETFFGEAFDIRLADGQPAASACVAFGIERWTLAFLVAHGPDAAHWPAIPHLESATWQR